MDHRAAGTPGHPGWCPWIAKKFSAVVGLMALVLAAAPAFSEPAGGAPAPPASVRLRVVPEGFAIEWQKSPDDPGKVIGYEVGRATLLSGPFEVVARAAAGVTTTLDATAKPEHIYFYKVRAVGEQGASAWSREATGEKPGMPAPRAPPKEP